MSEIDQKIQDEKWFYRLVIIGGSAWLIYHIINFFTITTKGVSIGY